MVINALPVSVPEVGEEAGLPHLRLSNTDSLLPLPDTPLIYSRACRGGCSPHPSVISQDALLKVLITLKSVPWMVFGLLSCNASTERCDCKMPVDGSPVKTCIQPVCEPAELQLID